MTHTTPQPAAELSDAQIEGALDALVAEGETVRWYLEQAFSGDDTVVRDIMVREVARTILAAATPQPQALPELPEPELVDQHSYTAAYTTAQMHAYARAALASQPPAPAEAGRVVPDGWRLVPENLTADMRNAFHGVTDLEKLERGAAGSRWAAMLAAAPQPEPAVSTPAQPAVDYSGMSREQLERHAARMAQALGDDRARKFWERHALGPKAAPSCLCCGRLPEEVAIKHLELPGIVVCAKCRDAALAPPAPPAAAHTLSASAGAQSTAAAEPAEALDVRWEICQHCGHDMKEPCHHNSNPNQAKNCHWNQERTRVLGTGLVSNRPDSAQKEPRP